MSIETNSNIDFENNNNTNNNNNDTVPQIPSRRPTNLTKSNHNGILNADEKSEKIVTCSETDQVTNIETEENGKGKEKEVIEESLQEPVVEDVSKEIKDEYKDDIENEVESNTLPESSSDVSITKDDDDDDDNDDDDNDANDIKETIAKSNQDSATNEIIDKNDLPDSNEKQSVDKNTETNLDAQENDTKEKLITLSSEDTTTPKSTSQVLKKKSGPPPIPVKPSSKIAAFQKMLQQQQEMEMTFKPIRPNPLAKPRSFLSKSNSFDSQDSDSNEILSNKDNSSPERTPVNTSSFVNKHSNFVSNLNGILAGGIPGLPSTPGTPGTPSIPQHRPTRRSTETTQITPETDTKNQDTENKESINTDKEQVNKSVETLSLNKVENSEPVQLEQSDVVESSNKTRSKRARGPKGRKLPTQLQNVEKIQFKESSKVYVLENWTVSFSFGKIESKSIENQLADTDNVASSVDVSDKFDEPIIDDNTENICINTEILETSPESNETSQTVNHNHTALKQDDDMTLEHDDDMTLEHQQTYDVLQKEVIMDEKTENEKEISLELSSSSSSSSSAGNIYNESTDSSLLAEQQLENEQKKEQSIPKIPSRRPLRKQTTENFENE